MSQIESGRRLLKNTQAEFERATFSGKNESGVRPIGTSVLVLMDQVATTTSGEAGAAMLAEAGIKATSPASGLVGIGLAPDMIAKMNMASESGVIAAVGDAAFRYYDDGSKWVDYKPKAGDRVFTERYAGRELLGQDGNTYRMMTYTCIAGIEDIVPVVSKKLSAKKFADKKKG